MNIVVKIHPRFRFVKSGGVKTWIIAFRSYGK